MYIHVCVIVLCLVRRGTIPYVNHEAAIRHACELAHAAVERFVEQLLELFEVVDARRGDLFVLVTHRELFVLANIKLGKDDCRLVASRSLPANTTEDNFFQC